jgi:hypothetical protein
MNDMLFRCFSCERESPFEITVANRDEVRRLVSDDRDLGQVNFICVHCGYANLIEISIETATRLLARISSNDPEVQQAIDRAKEGDFSSAVDLAARKIGFRL